MSKLWNRYVSTLLILALVITLLPPMAQTALAAANLQILNWKTGASQPADPSKVTSKTIDVEVDFTQISDSDLPKLYFEITNINSSVTKEVKDNPAAKIGTQRVVFRGVELNEGMNKITVILDTASKPRSLPAWINFTAVTTISDLTVENQPFTSGMIVPQANPLPSQTSVFIDGIAPNATEVTGYTTLNPAGVRSNFFYPQTGNFSFSAGETNVDLKLRPGDNDLTILASNPFKSYRAERTFVYNNGLSFLYNTSAKASDTTKLNDPSDRMLFRQPTFSAKSKPGPYQIDVTTDVKINRKNADLTHSGLKLELNGNSQIYDVTFSNLNEAVKTVDYNVTGPTGNSNGTVSMNVYNDYYEIKGLSIPKVNLDSSKSEQLLQVTFKPRTGYNDDIQTFPFFYVNELDPFVSRVQFRDSGTELFSGIEVAVSLESIDLLIQTENGASGVNAYMPSKSSGVIATSEPTPLINSVSNFTETAIGPGNVNLSWTASTGNRYPINGYEIYYAQGVSASKSNGTKISVGAATSHSVTGLSSGTTYTFAIYGIDNQGNYSPARTVTVTTSGPSGTPVGKHESGSLASAASYYIVTLNKSQLPEGRSTLRFVPFDSTNAEFLVGSKEYLINYNPSPYVYLTNIQNGQIFSSLNNEPQGINPDGTKFNGPVLQVQPVNIPSNQFGDIRVRLNDQVDKIRPDKSEFPSTYSTNFPLQDSDVYPATGAFKELRFFFGTPNALGNRANWKLSNGLNTLIFEVYPKGTLDKNANPMNGAKPVTTFKYELFYFSDDLPQVANLDIESGYLATHNFTHPGTESYRYYTQEPKVQLETSVAYGDKVNIIANRFDKDSKPIRHEAVLQWNSVSRTFDKISDPGNLVQQIIPDPTATSPKYGFARIVMSTLDLLGTGTNTFEVTATNTGGLFNTKTLEVIREPATFIVHYPTIDPVTKIGTINGNYSRIYLEAEGASQIMYGKNQVLNKKQSVFINGVPRDLFVFEVKGLKKGTNRVSFTIKRGTRNDKADISLVNADTPTPGAEFKDSIAKSSIKAFNNQFQLSFPKGTILKRPNPSAADQALSPSRDVLVGIADPIDGRVNKTLHPMFNEVSKFIKKPEWETRYLLLQEPTQRFRPASQTYWIDAGTVPLSGSQGDILYGSGIDPYENDQEFYTRNASNVQDQFVPSKPGQLTLSYDPNMVQASWRYVTVFHYGYNEDYLGNKRYEWVNLGGKVDAKKKTVTVPMQEFGYYVVMYMDQTFDDITGHAWARDYFDTLYSKGIMRPKESTRFETNEPVSRGEFTTLITKAYALPLNYAGKSSFSDVRLVDPYSQGLYEYKYIETAARAGIIRGTLGNRFSPNQSISRIQAATIIAKAANMKVETNAQKARAALEKLFTDTEKIDDYSLGSVLAVSKAGLITGKPNVTSTPTSGSKKPKQTYYFDPNGTMTRAEAAAIIMKVLLNAKKIPSL